MSAEAASSGQLAAAGSGRKGSAGAASAPPAMPTAIASPALPLAAFASAFQLACSAAAASTASMTVSDTPAIRRPRRRHGSRLPLRFSNASRSANGRWVADAAGAGTGPGAPCRAPCSRCRECSSS